MALDGTTDLHPMSEAVACKRLLSRPENMTKGILEPDTLQPKPLDGLFVDRTLVDLDAETVPNEFD